jgi:hypothetical protein
VAADRVYVQPRWLSVCHSKRRASLDLGRCAGCTHGSSCRPDDHRLGKCARTTQRGPGRFIEVSVTDHPWALGRKTFSRDSFGRDVLAEGSEQQLQEARWRLPFFGALALRSLTAAAWRRVGSIPDIAEAVSSARGAAPHTARRGCASSNSAIGLIAVNGPQSAHGYSEPVYRLQTVTSSATRRFRRRARMGIKAIATNA